MKRTSNDSSLSVASEEIAIVGAACRLPGAADEMAFEQLLRDGASAVKSGPEGRWSAGRFYHPRATEPGFSYSFAGGYLDNPFDFDPTVFGMSPREAAQVDPQQRLLLEVVWEALEDARIPPSSIVGQEVGVYVGASSLDHGNLHASDLASIDSHFMTGNTLSIVSNRISYAFDLRGPSFTVDTACSSSLVAFNQALSDLRLGRIDMAVVAGVNLLFSPASFVGFSRASMLSPTGLCRPFSNLGDGYVRSEGAVAIVLQRAKLAVDGSIRAYAVASGVNSDGKTSGIALPGLDGQKSLLDRLYGEAGVSPDSLAFIEAHGTGTRVGDPIEANAIGRALGMRRRQSLPIGSVKSNIGHLEPASGVAGIMKALIALKTRRLPKSLHLDALNPLIDFKELNLTPAREPVVLDQTAEHLHCGVSSFGFGGTNAHVILKSAPAIAPASVEQVPANGFLTISAASREALSEAARWHAATLNAGSQPVRLAAEVASGREAMKYRAVVALAKRETMARQLDEFATHGTADRVAVGTASQARAKVAFVYSGNGVQWVGMGRTAFRRNSGFRDRFTEIDQTYAQETGESLIQNLFATDLAERLKKTAVVQPLIFAIQSAITHGLRQAGLRPDFVLGHSVGELAAAESAGAIGLTDAIRIIEARAACQQELEGAGLMAVFASPRGVMEDFLKTLDRSDIEIACENGPSSVTLSGSQEAIRLAARLGRKQRLASRILDFEYPFHSSLLGHLRDKFLEAVGKLSPTPLAVPMISTVSGELLTDARLDELYWWRNIRQPVLFRTGVETAVTLGTGLFVEIGPKPILVGPIGETVKDLAANAQVISSLAESDERDANEDPIAMVAARALANGAYVSRDGDSGSSLPRRVDRSLDLPGYPWQRKTYSFPRTSEALDLFGDQPRHPLIGSRIAEGQPEWRTVIDADVVPYLADHVVDGEVVVPGAALAEMALAVARELKPEGPIGFEDFDILQPLTLPRDVMREISVRYASVTGAIEIWSRPRLGIDAWSLNGRGRLTSVTRTPRPRRALGVELSTSDGAKVYARASTTGIDYGPAFRLLKSLRRNKDHMDVELAVSDAGTGAFRQPQILHPASVDAALHGLFDQIKIDPKLKRTYVPVRFGGITVFRDHAEITAAELTVIRETDHSATMFVALLDATGAVVAELDDVLLRAVVMSRLDQEDVFFNVTMRSGKRLSDTRDLGAALERAISTADIAGLSDGWLMLRAHMRATAHASLMRLTDGTGRFKADALQLAGHLAPEAVAYATMLADDLVAADMARVEGDCIVLQTESGLPDPDLILLTFAAEFPASSAELRLSGLIAQGLDRFLGCGANLKPPAIVLEQFEIDSLLFAACHEAIAASVEALIGLSDGVVPEILLLEPDCRGLLGLLLPKARSGAIRLTIAGADSQRLHFIASGLPGEADIGSLDLSIDGEAGVQGGYDLAVTQAYRLDTSHHLLLQRTAVHLSPDGRLLAVMPPGDPLIDFYFGTDPAWFARSLDPSMPVGPVASAAETEARLVRAGWMDARPLALGDGAADVLVARPPLKPALAISGGPVLVSTLGEGGPSMLATAVRSAIRTVGGNVLSEPVLISGNVERFEQIAILDLGPGDDLIRTERALGAIKAALAKAAAAPEKFRLWLVVRGAEGLDIDPVVDAVLGFGRVALNEYDKLDIRLIEVERALSDAAAASSLAQLIAAHDREREVRLGVDGISMRRVARGIVEGPTGQVVPEAMSLDFPRRGMLEHFAWKPVSRRAPALGEIEVEVIATGLNFRDVMLAMGLLGDDVLDDGMAGAVFGFECVGRVVAVGQGTGRFAVDDIVVGFAANAFSTHVTVPEAMVIPLPAGLEPDGAATVPVAFLTAWYGLVEMARLKRGERVLIHGAAGGVGLAAMQIARARGAEIIATVSTPDKRALVQLFGATRIYDSRSLQFAEDIRTDVGGVDVVLNSLSGDAMRAGIKCLKPFGRFVELGKRDYVANTELGLRPFRRNLTYYGVDLDQLLAHNPALVAKGLKYVAAGFNAGRFTALPFRAFSADEIGAAFRLMQSAGHVGKIIVRPRVLDGLTVPAEASTPLSIDEGVQLVIGGTGGFGLATALWLAEKGARRVVVASRQGRLDDHGRAEAARLKVKGITFVPERVDVADIVDLEALIARVVRDHGPITGIFHSAMVLDDGLIQDLEPARLASVLAPKIAGSANLDRATRGQPIARFVLFSSATTLIGNPGQAAYVAANAYLQGIARRRVSEGLPALSVAWGAISDAGVLARDPSVARKIERMTGVIAMPAADALGALERLLVAGADLTDPSVICASFQLASAVVELPIIATPAFESAFSHGSSTAGGSEADLAQLLAGKSEADARRMLSELISGEVARILRLPVKDVDLDRPLSELGMDSLMALELRMCIEAKFGIELPLVAITAVNNLRDLSARILSSLRTPGTEASEDIDSADRELILIHGGDEAAFADMRQTFEARRVQVERVI